MPDSASSLSAVGGRRAGAFGLLPPAALVLLVAAGCGGQAGQAAPPPGPVAVGIAVLEPKPVARTSDFVATLRSRSSTEVRPQVDGIITRIFVKSGDRVSAGRPLMQIDPLKQEAAVESDQASRVAQEATVRFARQQYDRAKELFAVGAISRQEYEQAEATVNSAEAALEALKAREQESRVQLRYYQVSVPAAGTVGDIPVRVGDRVTTSTILTTIDRDSGLEVYVQVPIERAPDLRTGLPVRLVDGSGAVMAETAIDFISPQVDDRTQTVLAKAPAPAGHGFRNEQFVRARLVWSTDPGLTIPAVAVARINGQYFAYVAEPSEGEGFVAKQRAVRLGDIVGNDYLVIDWLGAGDRVIVSGIQKVGDGVPVAPQT